MSSEQKSDFVNSVFKVIEASGCDTITEISENPVHASAKMIKCLAKMDKSTKSQIDSAMKALHNCIKTEIPILRLLNL
jgi:hypothetical protein